MNNTHPEQEFILYFDLFIEMFLYIFHCLFYVFELLLQNIVWMLFIYVEQVSSEFYFIDVIQTYLYNLFLLFVFSPRS